MSSFKDTERHDSVVLVDLCYRHRGAFTSGRGLLVPHSPLSSVGVGEVMVVTAAMVPALGGVFGVVMRGSSCVENAKSSETGSSTLRFRLGMAWVVFNSLRDVWRGREEKLVSRALQ